MLRPVAHVRPDVSEEIVIILRVETMQDMNNASIN
jgi:hypothetical protein